MQRVAELLVFIMRRLNEGVLDTVKDRLVGDSNPLREVRNIQL
jgi:hypothetical protein